MSNVLLIFAKNPVLGKTKTRIGKKLGDEVALAVYYKLINKAQQVTSQLSCAKIICYSDFVDREDSWNNDVYDKKKQKGSDLGVRMFSAILQAHEDGYEKVVLIGTDIYDLRADIIIDAFEQLEKHDVVIGPARDGGYYLIGMRKPNENIFKVSTWSTASVLSDTIDLIKKENLSYVQMEMLKDIDEPEDLEGTDLISLLKD